MYRLVVSNRFRKRLKLFLRKHPELVGVVDEKIDTLIHKPTHSSLKSHKLTGELKDYWALSLTYEYRIVFSIEEDTIELHAIGTHNEVY